MAPEYDTQGVTGKWEPAQKGLVTTLKQSNPNETPEQRYFLILSWTYTSSQQNPANSTIVYLHEQQSSTFLMVVMSIIF